MENALRIKNTGNWSYRSLSDLLEANGFDVVGFMVIIAKVREKVEEHAAA